MDGLIPPTGESTRPDGDEPVRRSGDPDPEDLDEVRDRCRRLLEPDGHAELLDLLRRGEVPAELFELTAEERRVFDTRWDDGFLKQYMHGEFDSESPLTEAEYAELLTTTDRRRRAMLEVRYERHPPDVRAPDPGEDGSGV